MAAFITNDDLGDYLGQNLTASDKATLCVEGACDIVRTLTEQLLDRVTDDVILMDGTGTESLLLPQLPIVEVDTVYEDDELLVQFEDYDINSDGVLIRLPTVVDASWSTQAVRRRWPVGRKNIEVTYTHGYTSSTLPKDLKMVAVTIAARLFNESAGNVISETLGQYSVRYSDTGTSDLTYTEKTILRKYRVSKATATSVVVS